MLSRLARNLYGRLDLAWTKPAPLLASCLSTANMPEKVATQTKLPKLPVPPLHPLLERYLLSVRPLLNDSEYEHTQKVVEKFGAPGGLGVKLHSMLKEKAKSSQNWLEEWWLNSAYMEYRMPVIVYSSPGLVFPLKTFTGEDEQLGYTARLIAAALDFKMLVDKNLLPQDMMGNHPLDMSQYKNVFSTCRIPFIPNDHLIFSGRDSDPPKHIIIIHNNSFFSVDVYGDDAAPLNESQLLAQLKKVMEQSRHVKDPIGILTTQHRDNWAKAYKSLRKYDSVNKESIKVIQRAIFAVCLDKAVPHTGVINRKTHVALQVVHGGGSESNSGNRWYDKTIQFIVGADGAIGLTLEHSPAEGPPITSMMDHIVNYIEKTKGNQWLPSSAPTEPMRLRFNLSTDTLKDIQDAQRDLDIIVRDLEMSCFTYETYGREFVKSQRLSPDSFIQMAIQLAYYKLHNQIASTYESASTRKFLNGRTETIRSASVEAFDFCKVMADEATTPHVKAASLRTAVDAHKEYTQQAVNGLGIDRLLLGLKKIAIENGMNVPELFLDPGYILSTHFKVSTSQVPSKVDAFMCYGPLVPDGYGCCYNPRSDSINFGVSACHSSPDTDSSKFMRALIDSLTSMQRVLLQAQKSKL